LRTIILAVGNSVVVQIVGLTAWDPLGRPRTLRPPKLATLAPPLSVQPLR
jgi:hypothetical protein